MPGELEGDRVVVRDEREGSTLYNKGAFGTPRSGGGLDLDLVEAAYLVEHNRLEVREKGQPRDLGQLLARGVAAGGAFEIRWHVYRDLRGRTLAVKPERRADFQIYPRGALPGRDAATHLVHAIGERETFQPAQFVADAREAAKFGKKVLAALVDEEGDVTYYEARLDDPKGEMPPRLADLPGRAEVLTDRVLVRDGMLRDELTKEHYGRAAGPALELSLAEAVFLAERAGLSAVEAAGGARVDAAALAQRAAVQQPDFALRYAAYVDLRARGLVPKTGFKYGTHYRAYRGAPDESHAPFLVHAVPADVSIPWPDVAGLVRLSHGVRKTALLFVDGAYLRLTWTRP